MRGVTIGLLSALLCGVGVGRPAAADDEAVAATAAAHPPVVAEYTMPPAPLRPWMVTRHPVGDSGSHVLDVGFTPLYWAGAPAWWWMESVIYRDPEPRVRVRMAPPTAPPAP